MKHPSFPGSDLYPLLRPLFALATGILAGRYLELSLNFWLVLFTVFVIAGLVLLRKSGSKLSAVYFQGLSVLAAVFSIGGALYVQGKPVCPEENISGKFYGEVHKIIKADSTRVRTLVKIANAEAAHVKPGTMVLATFYDFENMLFPGDRIWMHGTLKPIAGAANPGQFDTKAYYGHKWITHQLRLRREAYLVEPFSGFFHFSGTSYGISVWARGVITRFLPQETAPTLSAILLGVKHEVSSEMLSTYQNTGVMHILAVSGMHAMIIYGGLIWLLRPLFKRWSWLSFLPVAFIWVFAFVTGAGPAVLRAALMITLIDFGTRTGNRNVSVNLLFASAFFLLILQPWLMWDIGFQLSYAAMSGIFLFFQPMLNLLYLPGKWVRELIWSPSVLSVSAQLATTPFTLYYFGNFSYYFILANVLVLIPITLILYAGMFFLLTATVLPEEVSYWLGQGLHYVIEYGFNRPLIWLEALPYAYERNIHISPLQSLFLVLSVLLLAAWIYQMRSGKWILYSLLFLLLSVGTGQMRYWQNSNKIEVVIPHVHGHSAVAIGQPGLGFLWADSILMRNPEVHDFSLSGLLRVKGWKRWSYALPEFAVAKEDYLIAGDCRFLRLTGDMRKFNFSSPVEADYLLLTEGLFLNVDALVRNYKGGLVVLDGGLSYRKRMLFARLLTEAQIPFHDTAENGSLHCHCDTAKELG